MNRLLRLEQQLMHWLAADYQRRVLRASVQRALHAFAAADPQATASLFDEHFVRIHLLPRLYQASHTGEEISAAVVADLWARQFSIYPERRQHYIAAIRPAATRFLHLLAQEFARQTPAPVGLPHVEPTAVC